MDEVTFIASNGKKVVTSRRVAECSPIIKTMLEDLHPDEASKPIPLAIGYVTLSTIIQWCTANLDGIANYSHKSATWKSIPRPMTMSPEAAGAIIKAANYLEIESLLEVACESLTNKLPRWRLHELLVQKKLLPPELTEKVLDYAGPLSQKPHFTRRNWKRDTQTLEDMPEIFRVFAVQKSTAFVTSAGLFSGSTMAQDESGPKYTELWMSISRTIITRGLKRSFGPQFLLATTFSVILPELTSCLFRVDESVSRVSYLHTERILELELSSLFSAAENLQVLKFVDIRPSEAIIRIIRDAHLKFRERTGQTVRIVFIAPAWNQADMDKLQLPKPRLVLLPKQHNRGLQRQMPLPILVNTTIERPKISCTVM